MNAFSEAKVPAKSGGESSAAAMFPDAVTLARNAYGEAKRFIAIRAHLNIVVGGARWRDQAGGS